MYVAHGGVSSVVNQSVSQGRSDVDISESEWPNNVQISYTPRIC